MAHRRANIPGRTYQNTCIGTRLESTLRTTNRRGERTSRLDPDQSDRCQTANHRTRFLRIDFSALERDVDLYLYRDI